MLRMFLNAYVGVRDSRPVSEYCPTPSNTFRAPRLYDNNFSKSTQNDPAYYDICVAKVKRKSRSSQLCLIRRAAERQTESTKQRYKLLIRSGHMEAIPNAYRGSILPGKAVMIGDSDFARGCHEGSLAFTFSRQMFCPRS
jgi:hypothetical protein